LTTRRFNFDIAYGPQIVSQVINANGPGVGTYVYG
jgi:hypothetical protein